VLGTCAWQQAAGTSSAVVHAATGQQHDPGQQHAMPAFMSLQHCLLSSSAHAGTSTVTHRGQAAVALVAWKDQQQHAACARPTTKQKRTQPIAPAGLFHAAILSSCACDLLFVGRLASVCACRAVLPRAKIGSTTALSRFWHSALYGLVLICCCDHLACCLSMCRHSSGRAG
jgi:hypothetical protein